MKTEGTYRQGRRQSIANLATTALQFGVAMAISLVLTPFIVAHLGVDAYGYIGLSLNIISYTAVLTVAVNSMSRRFVTVRYHAGDFENANRYYSSTFFANNAVSIFLIIIFGIASVMLERFIRIPASLVDDVRALFVLLFANSAVDLMFGTFNYSTFITNRLHRTNLLLLCLDIVRAVALLAMFALCPARLWYVGAAALGCTLIGIAVNAYWTRRLTPQLRMSHASFSPRHLFEMIRSSAWNVLSQLSDILNQGFELLLANLFIGPVAMGILAVTKTIPTVLLRFAYAIGNNFAPRLTHDYAQKRTDDLRATFLWSMRLLGLIGIVTVPAILVFSDIFYHYWLPGQDTHTLYVLTCVAMVGVAVAIPFEGVWYIFVLTNRVRRASLNLFGYAVATFAGVLIAVSVLDDAMSQLIAIVAVRSIFSSIRCLTFAPLYGARVLGLGRMTFYRPLGLYFVALAGVTALLLAVRYRLLG